MQAAVIRHYLAAHGINNISDLRVFSSITSTNDYLVRDSIKAKDTIAVCIADKQTRGRGRFGHQWWSPAGVNLYLSISSPLRHWQNRYQTSGLWFLIAIARLLERLRFKGVRLKWPNDICFQNKKLGGVLLEKKSTPTGHRLIVGTGMNIAMSTTTDVPLETPWVDLITIKPDWAMSRNEFAAQVIYSLRQTIADLENDTLANLPAAWRHYDAIRDSRVEFTYRRRRHTGIARGIDESGQILMQINGNVLHLHSAYVSGIKSRPP